MSELHNPTKTDGTDFRSREQGQIVKRKPEPKTVTQESSLCEARVKIPGRWVWAGGAKASKRTPGNHWQGLGLGGGGEIHVAEIGRQEIVCKKA